MSVCRSLVDRRQRPNPDTGGKATAAVGDGQDRLKARCVTDAEGEGLPGLARVLRRGKPDPAKASGTWRHPRPLSGRRKSRFWRIERPATSVPRRAPVSGSQREGPSRAGGTLPGRPVAGPGDRAVPPGCPGVSGWQPVSAGVSSGVGTSLRSRPAPGSSFRRCKTSLRNPTLGKTTVAKPLGPYPARFHSRL